MPLLGCALTAALLGGTAAGLLTGARAGDACGGAVALMTVTALASNTTTRRIGCTLSIGIAGLAVGAHARDRVIRPPLLEWFEAQPGTGRASGMVMIDGWLLTDASRSDSGVRLFVDVTRPAAGRLVVHVAGTLAAERMRSWTAGRPVRFPATLRRAQMLRNFGGASPQYQLLRQPAPLLASVKSGALIEIEAGSWWSESAAAVRRSVRESVRRTVGLDGTHTASIVTAILIGDRAGLDDDVERKLQAAGTYHVIAISGGNVALLIALCMAGLRVVLRSTRLVAVATLAFVVAFGAVVGAEPSVFRAVTAAGLYLAAVLIGVVPSASAVLRTTAAVLAVVNPLDVIDPGAWLSFGATLGIVLLATRWARAATGSEWTRLGALTRGLVTLVAATLAAEAVIAPVSATVFGRVSAAGVILNLIAIPAMAIIQVAGLAIAALGPLSIASASLFASPAKWATEALVGSADLVNVWPWLSWRVPPVPATWLAAYYAAGAWAVIGSTHWRRRIAITASSLCLAVILFGVRLGETRPAEGRARITVLDVGQGDAILVQGPGGHSLLVDTGGTPGSFDIGGRVVTPAVWALGETGLTSLALTHGDRDHVGGAIAVLHDLRPRELWEGVAVPKDPDRAAIRQAAASLAIPWRTIQSGDRIEFGDLVVEAARPPRPEWERQKVRNDDSIVLRIRFGHVEVWLTGDAGAEFESAIPADAGEAAIRVLKVGHHGSRTSTSAALVNAIRPQIAVISAGAGNLFGHPAPEVIARLADAGAAVFRTDVDGAVVVETDGSVVDVWTPTGRRWSVGFGGDVDPRGSASPRSRPVPSR